MLFYDNLEEIIFHRNELFHCDELIIISGYIGPHPVRRLKELPLTTTVIYGMYGSDGIRESLHTALLHEHKNIQHVNILYSSIPIHAKCYIWKYKSKVVHALVGSANFSTNGLQTPYKEILAETTVDTFSSLNNYIKIILEKSIVCENATIKENRKLSDYGIKNYDPDICSMPLYIIKKNIEIIPVASGINWGLAKLTGSHVNINDAYIKIGADLLEKYPQLFPMKRKEPTNSNIARKWHRHNDNIEIIWDDGVSMTGLLEGSVSKRRNGEKLLYPKQISTTPHKSTLGKYLRKRLGVEEGKQITIEDLERYGRKTIDISLQGEGIYYFDFSV